MVTSRSRDGKPGVVVRPMGERALLAEVSDLAAVLALHAALAADAPAGIDDLVPAARTVLVAFDPAVVSADAVRSWIRAAALRTPDAITPGPLVELPLRYDGADLVETAELLGIRVSDLIARHSAPEWTVAFTGFAPGFAYLVSDDWPFDVPRLAQPRTRVPAGAVGLAGGFSGAYPRETPGGWRLIGSTDAVLFDPDAIAPVLLPPRARVRFVPQRARVFAGPTATVGAPGPVASAVVPGFEAPLPAPAQPSRACGDGGHAEGADRPRPAPRAAASEAREFVEGEWPPAQAANEGESRTGGPAAADISSRAGISSRGPVSISPAVPAAACEPGSGSASAHGPVSVHGPASARGLDSVCAADPFPVPAAVPVSAAVPVPVAALRVLAPGGFTTVQDLGRSGRAALGVARSGALDRAALRIANRLLGNDESAAGLEIAMGGFRARAEADTWVCVTGAFVELRVEGRAHDLYAPVRVAAGADLSISSARGGLRSYLAVRGGIAAASALGSCATDVLAGLGPAPARAGDVIGVGVPASPIPVVDAFPWTSPPTSVEIRLAPGPRADWFTPDAVSTLFGAAWTVSPHADRVGLRLDGPELPRLRDRELPSEGMRPGAIQVPPHGRPVVLLADGPVTGGYPVIAVVTDATLDALAQVKSGDGVRFRPA